MNNQNCFFLVLLRGYHLIAMADIEVATTAAVVLCLFEETFKFSDDLVMPRVSLSRVQKVVYVTKSRTRFGEDSRDITSITSKFSFSARLFSNPGEYEGS